LSSRARQNLHRFRAGTTAGREIREKETRNPCPRLLQASRCGRIGRDQHAVTTPICDSAPAVGVERVPVPDYPPSHVDVGTTAGRAVRGN
jgi:hypothetical protein